jgi:hypothetical protein
VPGTAPPAGQGSVLSVLWRQRAAGTVLVLRGETQAGVALLYCMRHRGEPRPRSLIYVLAFLSGIWVAGETAVPEREAARSLSCAAVFSMAPHQETFQLKRF